MVWSRKLRRLHCDQFCDVYCPVNILTIFIMLTLLILTLKMEAALFSITLVSTCGGLHGITTIKAQSKKRPSASINVFVFGLLFLSLSKYLLSILLCTVSESISINTFILSLPNSQYSWIIVCFLLGNSPASEFCMPMFQNTLSVPSS
jgi:hypothetical protein